MDNRVLFDLLMIEDGFRPLPTDPVVRDNFKKLVRSYHPDKIGSELSFVCRSILKAGLILQEMETYLEYTVFGFSREENWIDHGLDMAELNQSAKIIRMFRLDSDIAKKYVIFEKGPKLIGGPRRKFTPRRKQF